MPNTQTYLTAAVMGAAGLGGVYLANQLGQQEEPEPVAQIMQVATATPATPAPNSDPEPFDSIDAMLNPFREIDAITKPAPPALPPPPLPVEDIKLALYRNAEADTPLVESIVAAFIERARLEQTKEIAAVHPIPLIPPAMPNITILEEATRLARIIRAAGLRHVPHFASGTSAWVKWRVLVSNPLASEADWTEFYAAFVGAPG
jgi:hypothetical protein